MSTASARSRASDPYEVESAASTSQVSQPRQANYVPFWRDHGVDAGGIRCGHSVV
jgi:hypothetical protein